MSHDEHALVQDPSRDQELAGLVGGAESLLSWAERALIPGHPSGAPEARKAWEAEVRDWRARAERAFNPPADGVPTFLKKQAG